jgi:uncharacterized OsmC-like protein
MADVTFSVDVECRTATCTEAQTRGFTFSVDEPVALGGTNTGPNPVEYIIGAYAGCLNVVGHMIAGEMGFTIDSMKIHIEGDLDPAGFMGKNPNVRPGYKEIRVNFDLHTNASDDTLQQWLQAVSSRCPVGDNLKNPTPISVSMTTNQS